MSMIKVTAKYFRICLDDVCSETDMMNVAFSDGTLLEVEDLNKLTVITKGRSFISQDDEAVYMGKDIKWYVFGDSYTYKA